MDNEEWQKCKIQLSIVTATGERKEALGVPLETRDPRLEVVSLETRLSERPFTHSLTHSGLTSHSHTNRKSPRAQRTVRVQTGKLRPRSNTVSRCNKRGSRLRAGWSVQVAEGCPIGQRALLIQSSESTRKANSLLMRKNTMTQLTQLTSNERTICPWRE